MVNSEALWQVNGGERENGEKRIYKALKITAHSHPFVSPTDSQLWWQNQDTNAKPFQLVSQEPAKACYTSCS